MIDFPDKPSDQDVFEVSEDDTNNWSYYNSNDIVSEYGYYRSIECVRIDQAHHKPEELWSRSQE